MSDEIEQGSVPAENSAPEPQVAAEPVAESVPDSQPVASSPWDAFKQLPEFQGSDDRAIAARLYQTMQREQAATRALQQYQSIMPVTQEYLSHRPEFQKWRESQRAQQAPPPQETKKWWNPPEVKDSYRRYLVKDENGRDTISPDAPLDARQALLDWQNYRADFAQKFLSNPEEALGPMVAEMAQKQAQEMIQQQLETRDKEAFVSNWEAENKDWLYDQQTGSVSPAGLMFHKYVEEARAKGINGPEPRAEYATAMTELELWRQRYGGSFEQPQAAAAPQADYPEPAPAVQPPPQPEPQNLAKQNMEYLRREASRNPSRSAGAANNDPRQSKPKRTFEQMLMEEAASKGLL
jgi:hypothetical protein